MNGWGTILEPLQFAPVPAGTALPWGPAAGSHGSAATLPPAASRPAAGHPRWGSWAVTAFGKSGREINSLSRRGHWEKGLADGHLRSGRAPSHRRAAGERDARGSSHDTEGKGVSSTTWRLQAETREKGFGQTLGNGLDRGARPQWCSAPGVVQNWMIPASPTVPSPG